MAGYVAAAQREVLLLLPPGGGQRIGRLLGQRPRVPYRKLRVVMADRAQGQFMAVIRSLGAADQVRCGRYAFPSWLLVADREVAVLSRAQLNVEVRSPATINELVGVFEGHWLCAERLPHGDDGTLSDLERHIIARLSAGLTDAAVANELAVSPRTIQRYVKRVMDLCGARSRLELGIRLARRDLI
jgi:DNA-binding CsgD family transcriptional regulator